MIAMTGILVAAIVVWGLLAQTVTSVRASVWEREARGFPLIRARSVFAWVATGRIGRQRSIRGPGMICFDLAMRTLPRIPHLLALASDAQTGFSLADIAEFSPDALIRPGYQREHLTRRD